MYGRGKATIDRTGVTIAIVMTILVTILFSVVLFGARSRLASIDARAAGAKAATAPKGVVAAPTKRFVTEAGPGDLGIAQTIELDTATGCRYLRSTGNGQMAALAGVDGRHDCRRERIVTSGTPDELPAKP